MFDDIPAPTERTDMALLAERARQLYNSQYEWWNWCRRRYGYGHRHEVAARDLRDRLDAQHHLLLRAWFDPC